jgi:hypothetical protein
LSYCKGCGANYGAIYSINPLLVIFLVPLLTTYTVHYSCFKQILVGCWISALSVFILLSPVSYASVVMFVIVLAFGEALWSPRLYEYSANIAPHGKEGTYFALASVPNFLATIFTGGLSGTLLSKYCECFHSPCGILSLFFDFDEK